MSKTRNDEIYESGMKDGKNEGVIGGLANNFLKDTAYIGDSKAREIYQKGIEYGREHRNDSSGSDSSSSPSSDSGSGSGCFITTACVNAIGLPNACLELRTLRNFRDSILMPDISARKAVREYYRAAPEIVIAVNQQEDAQRIWQEVYKEVRRAVGLILFGDFEEAFRHYQRTTLKLKEKYLV